MITSNFCESRSQASDAEVLFMPLTLPSGTVLKNRIAKSAMSDALGDGTGHPTAAQCQLYARWADGGAALSVIGEVQGRPDVAEDPGNLVLNAHSDMAAFQCLARCGSRNDGMLWLQLGHAGAMTRNTLGAPKGPSAISLAELRCDAMTLDEIRALPDEFARTACLGKSAGFGGVQIHAAHGFLLSQFLSPLFNQRSDAYGGSIDNRMRLLIEVIQAVRATVGETFPISVKINATDQLDGGLSQAEALKVIEALEKQPIDLIDISGGTYFPGARSASETSSSGPYFLEFARLVRARTNIPLMLTGGFKTLSQACDAVNEGAVDIVGLARGLALEPALPNRWYRREPSEIAFPHFELPPEGGVTAWYGMRLARLSENRDTELLSLEQALSEREARDRALTAVWQDHFFSGRGLGTGSQSPKR